MTHKGRGLLALELNRDSGFAGLLNKKDAKQFEFWWTSRGHQVRLDTTDKKGIFAVYLHLNKQKGK